jgi:glyoxylase-like metal-dependent hydrolase (beta-lactamase superfamily II)
VPAGRRGARVGRRGPAPPEDTLDDLTKASLPVRPYVTVAEPDVLLENGDRAPVRGWSLIAVHTPGHSPGHLCFHEPDRRLVLTGDHVLPRITPNVSVHAQSGPDPLGDFLDSLRRVRNLAEDLSLPAHEWRFRGLASRVDELLTHHEQRLDTVEQLVAGGAETAWAVSERMPWSRPWASLETFMRRLAVGEVIAHLIVLAGRGRVARHDGVPERWTAGKR